MKENAAGNRLPQLPIVVCSMEPNTCFTHADICQKLGIYHDADEQNIDTKIHLETLQKKLRVELYLDRLVQYRILNHKGYKFWFGKI